MEEYKNFELIGHDCPLVTYPSPVTPIGRLSGKEGLFAVFFSSEQSPESGSSTNEQNVYIPHFVKLEDHADIVLHGDELQKKFSKFDYRRERLFAENKARVTSYLVENEPDFFKILLDNINFAPENPFFRLYLAKQTCIMEVIIQEIVSCMFYLLNESPETLDNWYQNQTEWCNESSNCGREISIPTFWYELFIPEIASQAVQWPHKRNLNKIFELVSRKIGSGAILKELAVSYECFEQEVQKSIFITLFTSPQFETVPWSSGYSSNIEEGNEVYAFYGSEDHSMLLTAPPSEWVSQVMLISRIHIDLEGYEGKLAEELRVYV